ncbi:16S rRNA (cytosine(967)-C(5))-methyltransferase RsmB [Lentibacillus saliphilus]|uniref:16S rRNA (cytosine(967)-C(5))-methyltransferase RsmB n=1 Tax=Lentibacillus saliphilus TaxID=2737028 RepID=UPI001C3106CB|nr:16S rRNA (cytosine(967)-C(5))-methyltransferase RsmB [Lentibacillus saliphilus]
MNKPHQLRMAILDVLIKIEQKSGYSHLVISHEINQQHISKKDEGLFTEIVYGTMQRKMTIDFYLDAFLKRNQKLQPWVKMLLRMSVYQMVYLDKVPDHAIIHEAVEIAKQRGHKGIASLINGVLRNIQRKGVPDLASITPEAKQLAIATSHPEWLVNRWISMYGFDVTAQMCHANLHHIPVSIRIQPLKTSRKAMIAQLEAEGFEVRPSKLSSQGIIIDKGNILKSNVLSEGLATIQDQSSMLVGELLDVREGMNVLDACSAPGGKATHIAEKMNNQGQIRAYDLHKKKLNLIQDKAKTLGLSIINTEQGDARNVHLPAESFDRILVDAPCSGLGVIRGKPDIKYNKNEADIKKLSQIQLDILTHIAPTLKKGGRMIYSTCTVDLEENEHVIQTFLEHHPEYAVDQTFWAELPDPIKDSVDQSDYGLQLFPHTFETDGFFLVRLMKK